MGNDPNIDIETQRKIYEICKDGYAQSWERIRNLDTKAQIYLAIFGFQFAVLGLNLRYSIESLRQHNKFSIAVNLFFLLTSIAIFLGMRDFFSALRIRVKQIRAFPDLNFIIEKFREDSEVDLLESLSTSLADSRKVNDELCEEKAADIRSGTQKLIVSFVLMLLWLLYVLLWAPLSNAPVG